MVNFYRPLDHSVSRTLMVIDQLPAWRQFVKPVLVGAISAFLTFTVPQSQARQQESVFNDKDKIVPRGEIRVVDKSPANWGSITYNVMEHLMDLDKDGGLVPRLATNWRWLDERTLEVELRRDVRFHNGEVFNADIVKLNWEKNNRLRQPHAIGSHFNFPPGSRLEIVDPYKVVFHFSRVDGGALIKLATMHIGNREFYQEVGFGEKHWCIVKAAGPWGTGPYKLVEGYSVPDERTDRVVLEANTDYWDPRRIPQIRRVIFDNTLEQEEAVELVKNDEGKVDIVTGLNPLETLQVAKSPHAKVVKRRGVFATVFGLINMQKEGSPWTDVRLRRALNFAVNREDVIRYAAKGNGVVVPALVPAKEFGYPSELTAYPFDPNQARQLLAEAGYPNGLEIEMLVAEDRAVQGTVIGRMLEHAGFEVQQRTLDAKTLQSRVLIPFLDGPPKDQSWDIALTHWNDNLNFPPYLLHQNLLLGGWFDWAEEESQLKNLYDEVLSTVDRDKQAILIGEIEAHVQEQAYLLFLYNPVGLYAVNKAVDFVPYITTDLILAETGLMDQHWSVRQSASVSAQ